ncbi:helix-turn-helix domain-containing protein [Arcicella rosea]|uniref:Transcriptional regulator with XRE-family HTH domain n=1 Tax=Arcicella rosea TaxID=502909 RepID=A0A841EE11_9BACT|nr:helix-turn-helix transcriptional regulator [Arcicella rosea]MBB6001432.1 transcriptional regulator with XRE-family HTH domain [Arcicella rosea]
MKTLDTEKFAQMVKLKRGNKGLRAVSEDIGGVSAPTLSRIEQGHLPDIDTYFKICKWLDVPTDFFAITDSTFTQEEVVVAHLRADKTLPPETASALVKMINLAYQAVKSGEL